MFQVPSKKNNKGNGNNMKRNLIFKMKCTKCINKPKPTLGPNH